jgi:hypothetical protein
LKARAFPPPVWAHQVLSLFLSPALLGQCAQHTAAALEQLHTASVVRERHSGCRETLIRVVLKLIDEDVFHEMLMEALVRPVDAQLWKKVTESAQS